MNFGRKSQSPYLTHCSSFGRSRSARFEPGMQPFLEVLLQFFAKAFIDMLAKADAVAAFARGEFEENLVTFLDGLGGAGGARLFGRCRGQEFCENRIRRGRRIPFG